jgi:hypothetical protein
MHFRAAGNAGRRLFTAAALVLAGAGILTSSSSAEVPPGSISQPYVYTDTAVGWPVSPINEQHPIRGSFLDPRPGNVSTGGDPGYHIGIDINVKDDQVETGAPSSRSHRVYAVEGGVASIPDSQADANCIDRKVTIGHFEYWHTDTINVINNGNQIQPGQMIGWTCKGNWHVHLSEDMFINGQWMYVNPLHSGMKLQPFTDTAAPVIHALRFYTPAMPSWSLVNSAVTSPDAGTQLDPTNLSGQVDVRAWIDDPQSYLGFFLDSLTCSTSTSSGPCSVLYAPHHPYRVHLTVTPQGSTTPVIDRDVFRADAFLGSPSPTAPIPIDYHYAPGTKQNLGADPCLRNQPIECKGVYWLRLFATSSSAYWDTTQYANGQYQIDVTAWDVVGNQTAASALVSLNNAATNPDFALTATPASQTVTQGGSATYTATVTPSGGFTGSVTLSASGLPTGASASFSPNPTSGNSTLTVTTSATTPTGTYPLTISGASGTLSHSTQVSLVVSAVPDFALTASPASQTVTRGGSATYTATITPSGGFTGSVTLSVSGLPAWATATFGQNPTTSTSTLTVKTTAETKTGNATLTITGSSGGVSHSTTVTLLVKRK